MPSTISRSCFIESDARSGTSCKDYCTEFWTHDVYIDGKLPVETTLAVFKEVKEQWGGKASSWNGFEKNVLYLNRGGTNFVNTAFLFGLAFESPFSFPPATASLSC